MVELVRDLRSSFGYIEGDFQTFASRHWLRLSMIVLSVQMESMIMF